MILKRRYIWWDPKGFFRQSSPHLAGRSCESRQPIAGKPFRVWTLENKTWQVNTGHGEPVRSESRQEKIGQTSHLKKWDVFCILNATSGENPCRRGKEQRQLTAFARQNTYEEGAAIREYFNWTKEYRNLPKEDGDLLKEILFLSKELCNLLEKYSNLLKEDAPLPKENVVNRWKTTLNPLKSQKRR